jgi:hypothetical protein
MLNAHSAAAAQINDPSLTRYLIATWAKLCQALGKDFEPCLPIVMPPLLHSAGLKADLSVVGTHDPQKRFLQLTLR